MIQIKRTYDPPARGDGRRVLVERLWPRGMKKEAVAADAWMKDVAPSTELRRWFGHRVERWEGFQRRYREELNANPGAWEPILEAGQRGLVTLRRFELTGIRTMFASFHHLSPGDARAFLASAVRDRAPVAVFDATGRTAWHFVMICFVPFLVLLAAPFAGSRRPLLARAQTMLLTYVLPAVPLGCFVDGIMSNLRSYGRGELRQLAGAVAHQDYRFEIGAFRAIGPVWGTYLLGLPVR